MSTATSPQPPPLDDALVDKALLEEELVQLQLQGYEEKLTEILETIVAFANSDRRRDRPGARRRTRTSRRESGLRHPREPDELGRASPSYGLSRHGVGASGLGTRRGGLHSSGRRGDPVVLLRIEKSTRIHSIVDNGTFIRLRKGNKQLTAPEESTS